ncbi:TPA: hypothetical protein QFT15_004332 [Klebsiella aerogenes]|nr:hypothetical protein [Klebsiella aerogenes]HDT6626808.1 hypothetical protein [Klebsiella aerogenes]
MSPDTKLIVDAIESLRQSSSFIKSYIMPFTPAVITAVIGFFIASYNFKSQEKMRADAQKIESANRFMIQIESAYQAVSSAKHFVTNGLNNDPVARLFHSGDIEIDFVPIYGVENMVFLANGNKKNGNHGSSNSWNNVTRINTMANNYRYLIQRINVRAERKKNLINMFP